MTKALLSIVLRFNFFPGRRFFIAARARQQMREKFAEKLNLNFTKTIKRIQINSVYSDRHNEVNFRVNIEDEPEKCGQQVESVCFQSKYLNSRRMRSHEMTR